MSFVRVRQFVAMMTFAAGAQFAPVAKGSVIFRYDFPGTPGNGAVSAQTSPQPAGAVFSDFVRVNLTPDPNAYANEFTSIGYAHPTLDLTQYAGFSINAQPGQTLNLTSLTFDTMHHASGPTKEYIYLYLNGDFSTSYASQFFSGTTTVDFIFTALTSADNVTRVDFRFYGYNAGKPEGSNGLGNVIINGDFGIAPVPEVSALVPLVALGIAIALHANRRRLAPSRKLAKTLSGSDRRDSACAFVDAARPPPPKRRRRRIVSTTKR